MEKQAAPGSGTGPSNKDLAVLEAEAAGKEGAAQSEPPVSNVDTGKLYAQLWSSIFLFASKRLGPHWALSPEEAEHLGIITAPVADKYLKGAMNSPESLLIASIAFTVIPRLAVKPQIGKEAPVNKEAPAQ